MSGGKTGREPTAARRDRAPFPLLSWKPDTAVEATRPEAMSCTRVCPCMMAVELKFEVDSITLTSKMLSVQEEKGC